jgi:hypothetical protein
MCILALIEQCDRFAGPVLSVLRGNGRSGGQEKRCCAEGEK